MEPLEIIANPNAAGGRGERILPELERQLHNRGIGFTIRRTEAPGHARELARAARQAQVGRILIVGGDGTIHEVANGLLEGTTETGDMACTPALAVLPMGTGNDFHRMVSGPEGVAGVVKIVEEGVARAFEVGTARWETGHAYFVNLLGVGVDVEVLRRRSRFARLPGVLQYLGALGSALIHYRPIPLQITLVGCSGERTVVEARILLSAVTVGPSVGGGFFLSPDARPDDGLLDLFLVSRLGLMKIVRYLPGVLNGTLATRPEIHQEQLRGVEIRSTDGIPLTFELDGELMQEETAFLDVGVQPARLRVLELPSEGPLR